MREKLRRDRLFTLSESVRPIHTSDGSLDGGAMEPRVSSGLRICYIIVKSIISNPYTIITKALDG